MTQPQDVLTFWFGDAQPPTLDNRKSWFMKDDAFDQKIRDRFEAAIQQAKAGDLDAWKQTPRGRLAFIILLDQFSRNIYRGTPGAWAQDALALQTTLDGLEQGVDRELTPVERWFFYMPLEHSEDRALQARCVALFDELRHAVPDDLRETFDGVYKYAVRHREIVDRFGRFPHRNEFLGRESSPEEAAFLKEPNSSF